tara:strand:- start:447 stop:554 length:108 start_codon:yes stop_codon:yes gene_type:complete
MGVFVISSSVVLVLVLVLVLFVGFTMGWGRGLFFG